MRRVENNTFLRKRATIKFRFYVDSGIIRNNNSDKTRIVRAIPSYRGELNGYSQSSLMKITISYTRATSLRTYDFGFRGIRWNFTRFHTSLLVSVSGEVLFAHAECRSKVRSINYLKLFRSRVHYRTVEVTRSKSRSRLELRTFELIK